MLHYVIVKTCNVVCTVENLIKNIIPGFMYHQLFER